jgi:CheY-like chemotaxis protein
MIPRMLSRQDQTVLVVDDNPARRYATVRQVREAGFKVIEAWNGQEALARAEQATAVVLDVFLPDMDGRDVCRLLRSRASTATLPVIHVSAVYATELDAELGRQSGSDAYLVDPVPAGVLVQAIEAATQAWARRRQGGGTLHAPG